jgi:hypothetical protein
VTLMREDEHLKVFGVVLLMRLEIQVFQKLYDSKLYRDMGIGVYIFQRALLVLLYLREIV